MAVWSSSQGLHLQKRQTALCVLVYFGRTREDFGQEKEPGKVKVGEWGTDGEERPGWGRRGDGGVLL